MPKRPLRAFSVPRQGYTITISTSTTKDRRERKQKTNLLIITLRLGLLARPGPIRSLLRESQQIKILNQRQLRTRLIGRAQNVLQEALGQQAAQQAIRVDRRRVDAARLLSAGLLEVARGAWAADGLGLRLRVGKRGGAEHEGESGYGDSGEMHFGWWWWWWWW